MNKIDIHTHIMPPELPDFKKMFGYGGFIKLEHCDACSARMLKDDGTFFRRVESNCWDGAVRIKEMDLDNIGMQVLSTIPVLFSYWAQPKDGLKVAQFLNDHLAQVVEQNPKRFVALATLPMQAPDLAIKELERSIKNLGMVGIEIGSHIGEWNLNRPEVVAVLEACQDLGAAVFVHPWDMMGKDTMPDYWLPWLVGMPAETSRAICSMIFGGVFDRLPRLRVAFAHGGGAFPFTLGRIRHGFHVRPDLCAKDNPTDPKDYLNRFYIDSLVHDHQALQFVTELMGVDSIMCGSDYPFPLGEKHPGQLIEQAEFLHDSEKQKLLHDNALKWLNLMKDDRDESAHKLK